MKDKLSLFAAITIIAAILAGGLYLEYSIWAECRATNGIFYCMRVLGK
jgi:hypothetical protein